MRFIDSHSDTPSQIYRLRDITVDGDHAHVDFPKMLRGDVGGSFFSLYTSPEKTGDEPTVYALDLIGGVYDAISKSSGRAALAVSPDDYRLNSSKGVLSIFMGMENGSPIKKSISLLRTFYKMGVRYMTLTHNKDNFIADSAAQGTTWHGLSPFGREVVSEMNKLGMMVDISHSSDETFWDCIEFSKAPIIASHSSCRALCHHRRNLTDEMIKAIAEKDGYVGITIYPGFISNRYNNDSFASSLEDEADRIESVFIEDPSNPAKRKAWYDAQDRIKREVVLPGVEEIVDHIDHAVAIAGIEHVGIGTDFDGVSVLPEGINNITDIWKIFDEMRRRGYSSREISLVSGENLINVLDRVISCSESAG